MHRETTLTTADLIWPLFVTGGEGVEEPVSSLPGVSRWSIDGIAKRAREAVALGIPCLALFPNTPAGLRSEDGAEALNPDNLMCRAIKAIKDADVSLPAGCHLLLTISEEVGVGASHVLHGNVPEMVFPVTEGRQLLHERISAVEILRGPDHMAMRMGCGIAWFPGL